MKRKNAVGYIKILKQLNPNATLLVTTNDNVVNHMNLELIWLGITSIHHVIKPKIKYSDILRLGNYSD